jgi:hypothetical protein
VFLYAHGFFPPEIIAQRISYVKTRAKTEKYKIFDRAEKAPDEDEGYSTLCVLGFRHQFRAATRCTLSMADTLSTPSGIRPDDISLLVRRRAEIREEMVRGRQTLRTLVTESQQIDATLRQLRNNPLAVRAEPAILGATSDLTRIVFEALNEAEAPMTSKALALRVMEELGLDTRDKALLKQTVRRVCVCLWMQAQKGYFRKAEPAEWPLRWERVPAAQ